jgi:hypothetical protein
LFDFLKVFFNLNWHYAIAAIDSAFHPNGNAPFIFWWLVLIMPLRKGARILNRFHWVGIGSGAHKGFLQNEPLGTFLIKVSVLQNELFLGK